jgi:hypothetical protein
LLFKRMFGKVFLCLVLVFASLSGLMMDPKKIEELMYSMNQIKVEFTIPEQDDQGGPK